MKTNKAILVAFLGLSFYFKANSQSITITPNKGEESSALNVTITGNNTTFGQGSSCISPSCTDLSSGLYFKSGSSTFSVPLQEINYITPSEASVSLILPQSGYYQVTTANGLPSTTYMEVTSRPRPIFSITPTSGIEGTPFTTTLVGENLVFDISGSCTTNTNCVDLSGGLYYFNHFFPSVSGHIPPASITLINSSQALLSMTLPVAGIYTIYSPSGIYSSNSLQVYPDQTKRLNISPGMGEENTTLSVTITGTGSATRFGQGSSCIAPSCTDLGTGLYFQSGSTTITQVPYNSLSILDDTTAVASITLPEAGNYVVTTSSGSNFNNSFYVSPRTVPTVNMYPAIGEAGSPLTVTITGTHTTLGQGEECNADPNCIDLGSAFYFQQGSSSVRQSLPFSSLTFWDSYTAQVTFTLPSTSGYYQLFTQEGQAINGLLLVNPKSNPSITLNPNAGEEGTTLRVSITGNDVVFKQGSDCVNMPNCKELGTLLYFTSGSSTFSLPLSDITYLHGQLAEATVTLPSVSGVYSVSTATGLKGTENFTIVPKPGPQISITPNSGVEGSVLKVTFTGTNLTFGKGKKCTETPGCVELGNELLYFSQGSQTMSGTLSLSKVKQLDKTNAEATITLPAAGLYSLKTTSGVPIIENLYVSPKPAPTVSISPNTGSAGEVLKVTITGSNTNFKKPGKCANDPTCTDLGTGFLLLYTRLSKCLWFDSLFKSKDYQWQQSRSYHHTTGLGHILFEHYKWNLCHDPATCIQ